MHLTGAITPYIDVAQLTLYAFWIFFAGLIIYLILESKREGFPMITDRPGERPVGILPMPTPKIFNLYGGGTKAVPWNEPLETPNVRRLGNFEGAPYEPLGNPMLDGVGPAGYAQRAPEPELTPDGHHRTVPIRIAADHWVAPEDPDPRGMDVFGADGLLAGVCSDLWIDRTEAQARFLEVALPDALARRVLVPMELVRVKTFARGGHVKVGAITAAQFLDIPPTESPDFITAREEDRISAYVGSGHLYALPSRMGPLI